MNPTADQLLPPPPQPPQPHRSSFSCDRHPAEQFSGFCPSCLCERLTTLETTTIAARKSSGAGNTSSTAAAALKAIFKVPGGASNSLDNTNRTKNKPPSSSSSSSFFPELRRTQSFSASKNEGFSGVFEPQRRSCDVRGRSTLWSLFSLGEEANPANNNSSIGVDTRNLGSVSSRVTVPVLETKEEEDEHDDQEEDDDGEIRASEEHIVDEGTVEEIVEESNQMDFKTMKDHMDLDSQTKKPSGMDLKEIAGSFWSAASVFSKKWQKWRDKQKVKKRNSGRSSVALPVEKPISRQFRETQSEIADYGFGRRSCDIDPRFSLDAARISFDAGRMSVDDSRYSFDEPRASWDGYMVGRTFPRLPPMVSVVEDPPPAMAHVSRSDTQIPVEEETINGINEDETIPGGSAQTREYYSDSSRRKKSLDRSSSIRKIAAAVVAEIDEMKAATNAKVSPATVDYFPGSKLLVGDRDLRDFSSNSLRDDCSETFELPFRDNASVVNGEREGDKKSSSRWSKPWKVWGFMYRRSGSGRNKDEDEKMYGRGNGVERSFSESWQELRSEANGDANGGSNRKVCRSNSSVSWRNSQNIGGGSSFGSGRKSSVDPIGNGKKRREEFVLERNRSARFNDIDNGLLRFYLAPMRRSGSVKSRSSTNSSQSIARRVLGLY